MTLKEHIPTCLHEKTFLSATHFQGSTMAAMGAERWAVLLETHIHIAQPTYRLLYTSCVTMQLQSTVP